MQNSSIIVVWPYEMELSTGAYDLNGLIGGLSSSGQPDFGIIKSKLPNYLFICTVH